MSTRWVVINGTSGFKHCKSMVYLCKNFSRYTCGIAKSVYLSIICLLMKYSSADVEVVIMCQPLEHDDNITVVIKILRWFLLSDDIFIDMMSLFIFTILLSCFDIVVINVMLTSLLVVNMAMLWRSWRQSRSGGEVLYVPRFWCSSTRPVARSWLHSADAVNVLGMWRSGRTHQPKGPM